MLDSVRHFEPIDKVLHTLDGMAIAKLNVFHWHLSDDQAFRAESKKFPKLTEVASNGLFYSQDQLREVVACARARGIRVVPEFDMPGHSSSTALAYPEFGSGEDLEITLPSSTTHPAPSSTPAAKNSTNTSMTSSAKCPEIFPDVTTSTSAATRRTCQVAWLASPSIKALHG